MSFYIIKIVSELSVTLIICHTIHGAFVKRIDAHLMVRNDIHGLT